MRRIRNLQIRWPSRGNIEVEAMSGLLSDRLSRYVGNVGDPDLDRPVRPSPAWVADLRQESR